MIKLLSPSFYSENIWLKADTPRPMIKFCREYFKNKPVSGIEIGVDKAINAESILNMLNIEKLFLIDLYESYIQNNKKFDFSLNEREAHERLVNHNNIVWIKGMSQSMFTLAQIPFNLDFIYIDGNHDFNSVEADIRLYLPHIRKGGIIGGHDFTPNLNGVIYAVIKHFGDNFSCSESDWWSII
jgi:hypothetical protein